MERKDDREGLDWREEGERGRGEGREGERKRGGRESIQGRKEAKVWRVNGRKETEH